MRLLLLALVCVGGRLARIRGLVRLISAITHRVFSIGAIEVLFGLRGPHTLVKDVLEVKLEVKLQKLWFLLQPRVFLLLPGSSLEDEGVETKDTHHLLHILGRVGRTQRGTSDGGRGLFTVCNDGDGGLDDKRGIGGFRLDADIVPLVVVDCRLILVIVAGAVGRGEVPVLIVVEDVEACGVPDVVGRRGFCGGC